MTTAFKKSQPNVTLDDVTILGGSDKALLCSIHDEEVWVPCSLILGSHFDTRSESEIGERGDTGRITVPGWFAAKNHLE